MRSHPFRLLVLTAIAAGSWFGTVAQAQTPKVVVNVPRLAYRQRVLPNGLTVFSAEKHDSPTVAIQVWYKVGSKDDPAGRSGFAHLFEHMMFKATRNMKAEMMDRLTEDVGGENNAYTQDDVTVFHETVPSNYLETLLWAEADRMANLRVDAPNFHSERLVVEEEYRSSVLAPPYGRLYELLIPERSFTLPGYARSTIGSIPELDSATLADVQQFHDTYYRPDNAVLVVVGDFDAAHTDTLIDRYFGRIPARTTPIPRVPTAEPMRHGPKQFAETGASVPLPAVALTYLTPGIADADAAALRVADIILSGGESSRLYRSLVYRQQIATDVNTNADLHAGVGLFTVGATAASGKTPRAIKAALIAELAALAAAPPSSAELAKALNQLLTGILATRETADGTAAALGSAAVLQGDPELVNTDLDRLAAVTGAEVQRVAARYFTDANRVEIDYTAGTTGGEPAGTGSATSPAAGASPTVAPRQTGATPPDVDGATGKTETPPPPGAPRPIRLPVPTETRLSNGLRVIVVPKLGTGLVTAELLVQSGGADDPSGGAGLAHFTAALLTKGTATRSASQIAEEAEALGTSINANAGWDSSSVSLSVIKTNLASAMGLLADVALHPRFEEAEVARLRVQELDDLQVSLQEPGTLARLAAARAVFGEQPYGHPLGGTPRSLKRLTGTDAARFHREAFQPGGSVLVVGGDIAAADALALARRLFGGWRQAPKPFGYSFVSPTRLRAGGRVVVIDKPDAGQAAVVVQRPAIARSDPDYHTALVANSVLGGGYSARLNYEVRVKRGLSYGAGSGLSPRRGVGPLSASAQTKNPSAAEVAALILREIDRLGTAALPESELTPRKAALSGEYARALETGGGLAGETGSLAIYGRSLTELSNYLPRIQAVTAAQVRAFAVRRLPAHGADIVIVGDAKQFLEALKKQYRNVLVIPAAKLDLDRPLPEK